MPILEEEIMSKKNNAPRLIDNTIQNRERRVRTELRRTEKLLKKLLKRTKEKKSGGIVPNSGRRLGLELYIADLREKLA
jgi:hypothetical protein